MSSTSTSTDALAELAKRVIETVESVDLEHDLSESLDSLVITCGGPGQFNIQIQTQDNNVDAAELHARVREAGDDDE